MVCVTTVLRHKKGVTTVLVTTVHVTTIRVTTVPVTTVRSPGEGCTKNEGAQKMGEGCKKCTEEETPAPSY